MSRDQRIEQRKNKFESGNHRHSTLGFETLESRQLLAAVTVGNSTDLVNGDTSSIAALMLSDGGDGISLREAVEAANADSTADEISFDPSLIGGTLVLAQGELELTNLVTIDGDVDGDGFADVTISGANSDRVFRIDGSSSVSLGGLDIAYGNSYRGGAVLVTEGSSLSLLNSAVRESSSYGYGGGIYNLGTLNVDNSTFENNRAYAYGFTGPGYTEEDPPFAYDAYASGGGIFNTGTATITNSTFSDNRVEAYGGGGYEYNGQYVAPSGGSARGGAIFNSGTLTLVNSTLAGNSAAGYGGYGEYGGEYGGGYGYGYGPAYGRATGAGIHNDGVASVANVTFSENELNSSDDRTGFGIYTGFSSTTNIVNSLFVSGGEGYGSEIGGPGAYMDLGGNVMYGNASDVFADVLGGVGQLADNGGFVQTIALLDSPFNPALDVGAPLDETLLGIDLNGDGDITDVIGTDARGGSRNVDLFGIFNGGSLDAGAYELDADLPDGPPRVSSRQILFGAGGRFDLWAELQVIFDSDVVISASSLSMFNDSTGMSVDLSEATFDYESSTHTASWTFDPEDPLPAAYYTYTLSSTFVTGATNGLMLDGDLDGNEGGDSVGQHYVAIPGDANRDGKVDVLGDAFTLVGNLGTLSGATWADGDFNGDGQVSVLGDAFILVGNLGVSVVPPPLAPLQLNFAAVVQPDNFENKQEAAIAKPKLKLVQPVVLSGHVDRDGAFAEDEFEFWDSNQVADGDTDSETVNKPLVKN